MKMNKLLLLIMTLFFIQCTYVSPKEVTLRVHELGEKAGSITVMSTPGRYAIPGWHASDYSFPITEQNYRWTADDQEDYGSEKDESIKLQIEGNDCTLDLGIRFFVNSSPQYHEQLKYLVTKYPTNLDGVVDGLLYDLVRGATKGKFEGLELDDVMDNLSSYIRGPVTDSVTVKAMEYAITIVEVYDISGLNAPESVMAAKQSTQESSQKIRRAEEDAKEQAIRDTILIKSAIAQAEANSIINKSLTNNIIEMEKVKKWDGKEAPGSNVIVMAKK